MTDVWSKRAELYAQSDAHREGDDLELLTDWARGARTALHVATGGGHVARRLREEGLEVVTCDPAPGMRPDIVCRAENLPFRDASFDFAAWLERTGCEGQIAEQVRELWGDRVALGRRSLDKIVLRAVKR
jgi:hypothetical protein